MSKAHDGRMRLALTIDPGIMTVGWAAWDYGHWMRYKVTLLAAGQHVLKRGMSREPTVDKARALLEAIDLGLDSEFDHYSIEEVVSEEPIIMGGPRGIAARGTGDVLDMAFFCGALSQWFPMAGYVGTRVNEWKGNLSKDNVNRRVKKALSTSELRLLSKNEGHDWDAVGIGLWALKVPSFQ